LILDALEVTPGELLERTGWELKPEGACKNDACVPMPDLAMHDGKIDVADFAARMGMPVATDEKHRIFALGPQTSGHVLGSVEFPHIVLRDFDGNPFDLDTARGKKMLLVAWASY
jgi:hypothetical protein